jgi:hypothetical protein
VASIKFSWNFMRAPVLRSSNIATQHTLMHCNVKR